MVMFSPCLWSWAVICLAVAVLFTTLIATVPPGSWVTAKAVGPSPSGPPVVDSPTNVATVTATATVQATRS